MPAVAAVVVNVVQVIVVAGVAGLGVNVSGASLPVVVGLVGVAPVGECARDVIVPVNALFFVARHRHRAVPVLGRADRRRSRATVSAKSGIVMTVPE